MHIRRWLDTTFLVCAVAATRFAFRSHYLYDVDSVNLALGMDRFDPRVYQPHPPGYFLYILLGRLLRVPLHDANLALVMLSILASCGTVLVLYQLALEWFGIRAAQFAGGLFLLSPLAWFHGTVALTYSVEAFFSAAVGLLCWHIYCGRGNLVFAAAVLLGISAGIRPSSLLFLGPLFLFSLLHVPNNRKLVGIVALFGTMVAWFLPMIAICGGFRAYFGALFSLWGMVPAKTTVFNSSPATSIARAFTIVLIYFLGFGAASIAPLGAMYRHEPPNPRRNLFTWVWIAPALGFFTFIFLKFVNSGYLLLLAAPSCTWLGYWASQWFQNAPWRRALKIAVIAACATVNTLIFLISPFYCSYRSVRRFEAQLVAVCAALPQVAPAGTLIVGFDSHFLGYRHAGYYLPDYLTVEYPEERLREGVRVFAMHRRNTRLLTALPLGAYSRFVLFPLPNGSASYRDYLEKVRRKLPSSGVRAVHVAGIEFITGPISDLNLLFPTSAKLRSGVSAPSLTGTACKQPCTPSLVAKPIMP